MNMVNNTTVKDCLQSSTTLDRSVLITVECLMTIFSLIGNILIVAVVYRNRKLRSKNVNYFIASMAVSDLLVPLIYSPVQITAFIKRDRSWIHGPFGEFTCRFVPYAVEASIAVSILTMTTIAAERLYCVLCPFKASRNSDKTRLRIVAIIWIVSFALQGYYLDLRGLDSKGKCNWKWDPERRKIQVTAILVAQIAVPFVLLVVFGSVIVFNLNRDKMNAFIESAEVRIRRKRNRKITLMMVVITMVFIVSWLPFVTYNIRVLYGDKTKDCVLQAAVIPVIFLYTVVNPLVYFAFLKGYRKGVKEILCCFCQLSRKPRCNPSPNHNHSPTNHNPTPDYNPTPIRKQDTLERGMETCV